MNYLRLTFTEKKPKSRYVIVAYTIDAARNALVLGASSFHFTVPTEFDAAWDARCKALAAARYEKRPLIVEADDAVNFSTLDAKALRVLIRRVIVRPGGKFVLGGKRIDAEAKRAHRHAMTMRRKEARDRRAERRVAAAIAHAAEASKKAKRRAEFDHILASGWEVLDASKVPLELQTFPDLELLKTDTKFIRLGFQEKKHEQRMVTVAYQPVSDTLLRYGASVFHTVEGDSSQPDKFQLQQTALMRLQKRPLFVRLPFAREAYSERGIRFLFRNAVVANSGMFAIRGSLRLDKSARAELIARNAELRRHAKARQAERAAATKAALNAKTERLARLNTLFSLPLTVLAGDGTTMLHV